MVVLHKGSADAGDFFKVTRIEDLKEKAPIIPKYLRFEYQNAIELGGGAVIGHRVCEAKKSIDKIK